MNIDKLLVNLLSISSISLDKKIDNIPVGEEGSVRWLLKSNGTTVTLENISNDLIKISFSTIIKKEGWGNSFVRSNASDNSIVVPFNDIKNFISIVTNHITEEKNRGFREQVSKYKNYKTLLENIFKSHPKDLSSNIKIEYDNSIHKEIPLIAIEDNNFTHVITFMLPKTESLLDSLEISVNFLIKNGDKYNVVPMSYIIPLGMLQEYPLLENILSIKRKVNQNLDEIINNLQSISEDNELLKIVTFTSLSETLPHNEKVTIKGSKI